MSENLAVRPAQLRPAARADKIERLASQLEKATPALAAQDRVAAAEKTMQASTKLESRAKVVRAAATASGRGGDYGGAPDVTGKGRSVDVRVY